MVGLLIGIAIAALATYHAATYLLWSFESHAHRGPEAPKPFAPLLTAWLADGLVLLACLATWPLGLLPPSRPRAGNGRPVALLHGWLLNRSSMGVLAARLRRDGRTVYMLNYRSTKGDLESMAVQVDAALREILRVSGCQRVDVVAHSMGGVVLRAVARYHDGIAYLGNVVTLGSPHQGTVLATMSRRPELIPLRPGSRALARLAEDDPVPAALHWTAIASSFDAIVFPVENAYYPGAFNIAVDYVGHHTLLAAARIYELVRENLDHRAPTDNRP